MESLPWLFLITTSFMFAVFSPLPLSGQEKGNYNQESGSAANPYIVQKTDSAITEDAVLDEAAWQQALVLELNYEVESGENVPPPVSTEVLLTYDAHYLYATFRCNNPTPSAICCSAFFSGSSGWSSPR